MYICYLQISMGMTIPDLGQRMLGFDTLMVEFREGGVYYSVLTAVELTENSFPYNFLRNTAQFSKIVIFSIVPLFLLGVKLYSDFYG